MDLVLRAGQLETGELDALGVDDEQRRVAGELADGGAVSPAREGVAEVQRFADLIGLGSEGEVDRLTWGGAVDRPLDRPGIVGAVSPSSISPHVMPPIRHRFHPPASSGNYACRCPRLLRHVRSASRRSETNCP
jgi:hypothetical protein